MMATNSSRMLEVDEIQDFDKLAEEIVGQLSVQQKTEDFAREQYFMRNADRFVPKLPVGVCEGKSKLLDKGKQKVDDDIQYANESTNDGIKRMAFSALVGKPSRFGSEVRIVKKAPSGPDWVLINPSETGCDYSSDDDD